MKPQHALALAPGRLVMNRQFTLYADNCIELGLDLPVGAEILFVMLPAVLIHIENTVALPLVKPLGTSLSTFSVMADTTPAALPSSTKMRTSSSAAKTGPRHGATNPSRSPSSPSSNVVAKDLARKRP